MSDTRLEAAREDVLEQMECGAQTEGQCQCEFKVDALIAAAQPPQPSADS